jgi:hypothetical protein
LTATAAPLAALFGAFCANPRVFSRLHLRVLSFEMGTVIDVSLRMVHYQRLLTIAAAFLLMTAIATPAWSQEYDYEASFPRGFAKQGGYVGISGLPNFTLDGVSFDGETWYKEVDGDEIFVLPKLNTRAMFRGLLGFRGRQGGLEVSYDRTKHTGTFVDEPFDAIFQSMGSSSFCPTVDSSRTSSWAARFRG